MGKSGDHPGSRPRKRRPPPQNPLGPAEVLDEGEVRALLATFSRRAPTAIRNRALVLLLWRAGLRISEALALQLGDVHLDGARPTLTVRAGGKFGKQRVVGIHAEAAAELGRWLDVRQRRGLGRKRYVFCTLQGGRLDASYVRAMLLRKRKRAGIERRVHPHAFRATLAVDLTREGVPLPAIRDVLGHANISSTDAYVRRVFPEEAIAAVIERAGPVLEDRAPDPRQQLVDAFAELDGETVERLLAAVSDTLTRNREDAPQNGNSHRGGVV